MPRTREEDPARSPAPVASPEGALHPLCSHAVHVLRAQGALIGRTAELHAIEQELHAAASRLSCVTLEGEPGIGKTHLLVSAMDQAEARGFTTIAVTADEEIRGPFLVARSIFGHAAAAEAAAATRAENPLRRVVRAISGRDDPALDGLEPDRKLLRTFDLGAVAVSALAAIRPVAILVDDLQWADDDSVRMLRYVVRSVASDPVFLLFTFRPDEAAVVTEGMTLLADMERMGILRRLQLARFGQHETTEMLQRVLDGPVRPSSAATIHAQAEGVPFIIEEVARAYREHGMLQEVDGGWTLAKNAERLVPSSVRTLIQRRGAKLPEGTRVALGEAAVLGRSFSLRDLSAIRPREDGSGGITEILGPALEAGLLVRADEPADFAFSHNQVRELALGNIPAARRQAIHAAIVDMLEGDGEPASASLPLLAHHALAAGDAPRAARYSVAAAEDALASHAPEEVLRLVDLALPMTSAAKDRLSLLTARDEALGMLRRPAQRLEVLAELAALAEAMGDSHLELEVMARRAAALRVAGEEEQAAELATRVRKLAADRGDLAAELAACLELGQALIGAPLGEAYDLTSDDADLDGAEEAFARAEAIARELGDEASLAAVIREQGVISFSRAVDWFVEQSSSGNYDVFLRAAAGETPEQIIPDLPIAHHMRDADARLRDALERYERLGDKRGVMSSLIGLAYTSFGPDIHFGPTAARRIEEIRRLATQMDSLSKESQREVAEAQMLYGVHVFARAKVIPDLAITRGEEAHRQARMVADHHLAFAAAVGTALAHAEIGQLDEAERWLTHAADAVAEHPTPHRARQLDLARGIVRAIRGDAAGMREHLERAVRIAEEQGNAPARAEALARLAVEAARLGADAGDDVLLDLAITSAAGAKAAAAGLPGRPPWATQADAAVARVHRARGDVPGSLAAARAALEWLGSAHRDDMFPEILTPVAMTILEHGDEEEIGFVRMYLQAFLAIVAQRTLDDAIRVRWFRGPLGRALAELAGPLEERPVLATAGPGLREADTALLRLLTEGLTNDEIAERLGIAPQELLGRLGELYGRIGAGSRGEATAFAFRERVV